MSPWATADADSDQARGGPLVVARPDRWEANGPKGSRQKNSKGRARVLRGPCWVGECSIAATARLVNSKDQLFQCHMGDAHCR